MKHFPLMITAAALLAAGAYAVTAASFQDKKGEDHYGKTQEAGAPMDETLPEWCKPGEPHKLLAAKAGKWNLKVRMFTPDGQMQESDGTSELTMIMGGRYLEDRTRGTFGGMPFEGRGVYGYDMIKEKYCGSWVDNFSTAVMTFESTWDPAAKTMTGTSEMPDMMTGTYMQTRTVEKMISNDHWISQCFQPGKDGKETKTFEIEMTRAK